MVDKRPSQKQVKEMLKSGTLIKQFEKMVYNIAHKMSKKYPDENYEELVSEGFWGIINYVPNYDPEKACLSTWMYKAAFGRMHYLCWNPKFHRHIPTGFKKISIVYEEPWSINFLRELSEEASFLARTVLEAPTELAHALDVTPRTSRRSLRRYLKKNTDWSEKKIKRTWEELSECLA
jgi:hypothetical protein